MAVTYNLKACKVNIQMEGQNGLEVLQYIQMNPEKKLDFVLLDLDMPIMNGFEACQQIIDFFSNKNIFKPEKTKKHQRGYKKKNFSEKSIAESVNEIIEDMYMHPLMVAYSGLVNDDVRKKCYEAGFKVVIESPLTTGHIKDIILSNLESRSESINTVKKEILKSSHEKPPRPLF